MDDLVFESGETQKTWEERQQQKRLIFLMEYLIDNRHVLSRREA